MTHDGTPHATTVRMSAASKKEAAFFAGGVPSRPSGLVNVIRIREARPGVRRRFLHTEWRNLAMTDWRGWAGKEGALGEHEGRAGQFESPAWLARAAAVRYACAGWDSADCIWRRKPRSSRTPQCSTHCPCSRRMMC